MAKEKILELCRSLAMSNGSYGRMLERFEEDPDYLQFLEDMNFKDDIDFILYIEG